MLAQDHDRPRVGGAALQAAGGLRHALVAFEPVSFPVHRVVVRLVDAMVIQAPELPTHANHEALVERCSLASIRSIQHMGQGIGELSCYRVRDCTGSGSCSTSVKKTSFEPSPGSGTKYVMLGSFSMLRINFLAFTVSS